MSPIAKVARQSSTRRCEAVLVLSYTATVHDNQADRFIDSMTMEFPRRVSVMKIRALYARFVLALVLSLLLAPSPSSAETRSDVYAGATCIPYPAFNSDNAMPYTYFIYGFDETVFCHFAQLASWDVDDLSYVLFEGYVGSGPSPMRVRLCVYSSTTKTCGAERTLSPGGYFVHWAAPPGTPPSYALGAYLAVRFPEGQVSMFEHFIPVWTR
jgi:hypothetical protein